MNSTTEQEKALAAHESVKLVKGGMIVGLGSGATASIMIRKLGEAVKQGLSIKGVPSSESTASLAKSVGIPLTTLEAAGKLDINIDGADEFDPRLRLIKGGGGALLREKVLAHNSGCNVIIVDSGKQVDSLGEFKLPVETIPFATSSIINELSGLGLKPLLRIKDGRPYTTDEGNYIVDIDIRGFNRLRQLNNKLLTIPGVVETGLFIGTTDILIMGKAGHTVVFNKNSPRKPN